MQHDIKVYLYDIISSIDAIDEYVSDLVYDQYFSNRLIKRAVERELEIIGEAINKILKIDKNIQITDARKIVDFRNQISHGYSTVSDRLVWGIIKNKMPILKNEVSLLMEYYNKA